MSNLIGFTPKVECDARDNLGEFVELCRSKLTVFGASLDFSSNTWPLDCTIKRRGQRSSTLVFSNLDTCTVSKFDAMREPFLSFAKAYIRYQYGMGRIAVSSCIRALRVIEAALCEGADAEVVRIDSHVLNRAVQIAADRYSENCAYDTGRIVERVANFLAENSLTVTRTRWRHPFQYPPNCHVVGAKGDQLRASRLPSAAALEALPRIFALATSPGDVIVSSILAILCSAPDRISEVLELPAECEVRKFRDISARVAYGLRWWPVKGADPMVKWIVPAMVGVVESAVGKIRKLTQGAREIARWYESHPTQIYLPEKLEYFRSREWLTLEEVGLILYATPVPPQTSRTWCIVNDVPLRRKVGKRWLVQFSELEDIVLKKLPVGFPCASKLTGLKYSETLFVMQRHFLHVGKSHYRCIIEPISYTHVQARLGRRSGSGIRSIFENFDFTEPDGEKICVTTHQFRHYLNTLAQAGGMSQLDIAKWSGRTDVRQNQSYDQEPTGAIVDRIRSAIGCDTRMFGPLSEAPRRQLIKRDEFARLKVPTAHTTDFGYCIHDYVMSSCSMHRDCLNCGELVCVKGDSEKERRIRQTESEATRLLAMAERAAEDGVLGAANWADHHKLQLSRVRELIKILDDPAVAHGSLIQLMPAQIPSRLDQADETRVRLMNFKSSLPKNPG
ncbi:integrase [Pandoraea horticolens]|uniref:Integrase n=1 Tax=Pandoraea horticolens TaxID=2508298 RepID=A0A5E4RAY1_9BURK|nr:integrase [Pandoraea horticolens]VVD59199.1 integrase [Pandoraea horticolens]